MGDWLSALLDRVLSIFRPDQLVRKQSAIILALLSLVTVALALYEIQPDSKWHYVSLLLAPAVAVGGWWSCREVYFRYGGERRLGIAYDSFKSDYEDWRKTKELLIELFADREMPAKIKIRHVPSYFIGTEKRWNKVYRKYRFMAVLNVKASKIEGKDEEAFDISLQAAFKSILDEGFSSEVKKAIGLLGQQPGVIPTAFKKVEFRANTIYHSIVLFIGIFEMTGGNPIEAARLFKHLDERLSSDFAIEKEPRRYVRWLEAFSLLLPSAFDATSPPIGEDLLLVKNLAVDAQQKYAEQFPQILPMVARTCFFALDFDAAYKITKESNSKRLTEPTKTNTVLNLAVLSLLKSDWAMACSLLRQVLLSDFVKGLHSPSLIQFADSVKPMGYESAIYLQVFYRYLFGQPVDPILQASCNEWVSQDASRDGLRILLNKLRELGIDRLRQKLPELKLLPSDYAAFNKKGKKKK